MYIITLTFGFYFRLVGKYSKEIGSYSFLYYCIGACYCDSSVFSWKLLYLWDTGRTDFSQLNAIINIFIINK